MKPQDEYRTVVRWGEPAHTDRRTLICFGVVRGGTSAVGGLLRKLGVYMGDCPVNNHEDPEFVAKANPHRIAVIEKRNSAYRLWGWKDPHAANYLLHVRPHLINPHYICVFRDSAAVAVAHKRWHKRDTRFALSEIILQQTKNILWTMNATDPCLLVSYEKLIAHPVDFAIELSDFAGLELKLTPAEIEEFLAPGSYKDVEY